MLKVLRQDGIWEILIIWRLVCFGLVVAAAGSASLIFPLKRLHVTLVTW